MPGDSPVGLRLPLASLPYVPPEKLSVHHRAGSARAARARCRLRRGRPLQPARRRSRAARAGRAEIVRRRAHSTVDRAARRHACVFMPPLRAARGLSRAGRAPLRRPPTSCGMPVHIEGYAPPYDPRIEVIKVTPDPGVIEVNMHPPQAGARRSTSPRPLRGRAPSRGSAPTSS